MEEYNKPTLNSIITDYFFSKDTNLNKSYKNASIILQINYDETCTMQEYLKHVCYLIDSNILGYKNNGDIYFKLHNKFPNMESSELVNLILEKLNNNEAFSSDEEECNSDHDEYIVESDKEEDYEHVDDTTFFVDEDTPSESYINFSDIPEDDIHKHCHIIHVGNNEGSVTIPSFTDNTVEYNIDVNEEDGVVCGCSHFHYTNKMCKHMKLILTNKGVKEKFTKKIPYLIEKLNSQYELNNNNITSNIKNNEKESSEKNNYLEKYVINNYDIKLFGNNTITCSCADFHYRGPNRYCKHMKELYENTINNNNNNDIQHLKGIFINYINTCNTNNKAICSC